MSIQALIFDFDGLILDTETPEVMVWKRIYAEHGQELPVEKWCQTIGGWGESNFDPAADLQKIVPGGVDANALRNRHRGESNALILNGPMQHGVLEILEAAKGLGLRCAVASSSERSWVEPHLERLGVRPAFEVVITGDDVEKGRTKPHPDVFLKALDRLRLEPGEALVFEDSPNGIRAARDAGLRVVGIPNPVTALLGLNADLVLDSLAALPLIEILKRIDAVPPDGNLVAAAATS